MKRLRLPLTLLACAAATPAAAQETEWWRIGDPAFTIVYRDATGCVERPVAPAADGSIVTVREDVSGMVTWRASSPGWRFVEGDTYDIRLTAVIDYPPGTHPPIAVKAQGFRDAEGRSGLALAFPYSRWAGLGSVDVALDEADIARPLTVARAPGSSSSLLHRCAVELGRIDRGSGKPVATPAVLDASRTIVTNDDYPSSALRREEQGTVAVRLTISAKGLVSDCAVVGSSGSAILDMTTCSLLSQRAQFDPALDADGRPTEDSAVKRWRWEIPGDGPPPPPPPPTP
ncbi:MAG: energy transducer TonB [Pseudomonadota bacterium]